MELFFFDIGIWTAFSWHALCILNIPPLGEIGTRKHGGAAEKFNEVWFDGQMLFENLEGFNRDRILIEGSPLQQR